MSRPSARAGRSRQEKALAGVFTAAAPLTGFGFAAAFGWLWFPALRDVLLPDFFAGTPVFRPLAFGLALGAGCLLYSAISGRLENATPLRKGLNAFLAHALCLALLGLAAICRNDPPAPGELPDGLPEILAGLAASLPGVWWFSRLLARGAGAAVAALAWAALVALLLSIPLVRLPGWLPGRLPGWLPGRLPGWLTEGPDMAFLALCIGLVAGLLAALFLLWWENRESPAAPTPPQQPSPTDPALPPTSADPAPPQQSTPAERSLAAWWTASPAGALAAAALLLFGLGALNVYAHGLGAFFPAAAHVCGLALSACILTGLPGPFRNRVPAGETGATELPDGRQPGVSPRRSLLAGACGLAVLSLCLPAFPQFSRILFPLGAALPEAASVALCALVLGGAAAGGGKSVKGPAAPLTTGLALAALLAAVNAGYLAGAALMELAGGIGPAIPGLVATLLLGAVSYPSGGLRAFLAATNGISGGPASRAEGTSPQAAGESGNGLPGEEGASPGTTKLPPAITEQLTERERDLALLLVRGYSNKEVAEALSLSENTVRWYIKKLNKRTGATDRPGLIAALLSQ